MTQRHLVQIVVQAVLRCGRTPGCGGVIVAARTAPDAERIAAYFRDHHAEWPVYLGWLNDAEM